MTEKDTMRDEPELLREFRHDLLSMHHACGPHDPGCAMIGERELVAYVDSLRERVRELEGEREDLVAKSICTHCGHFGRPKIEMGPLCFFCEQCGYAVRPPLVAVVEQRDAALARAKKAEEENAELRERLREVIADTPCRKCGCSNEACELWLSEGMAACCPECTHGYARRRAVSPTPGEGE